jgi:pyruvate-ferredoxin/flavodoxin oxidoreductase
VIDYEAPEFADTVITKEDRVNRTVALSAAMCPVASGARTSGLFDPGYYEDLIARPFREGTISEAPVLPGTGMFMPVGTGAGKDKGIFRRTVPVFDPSSCTGCLECALVCPDSAIPNTLYEIPTLLDNAIGRIDTPEPQREALRAQVYPWAEQIRQIFRADSAAKDLAEVAARAAGRLPDDRAIARNLDQILQELAAFPVARTRPFFDTMEKEEPGTGALFAAVVDPWKCTGCLQCVDVCGPSALVSTEQDLNILDLLEDRFERMSAMPNTPKRFTEDATSDDGDPKRLMLDHQAYYAMTGGHGACRGCGEVTATRLITTVSHALGEDRRRSHLKELEELVDALTAKLDGLSDAKRAARIEGTITELEHAMYLYEGGPTGNGPASTVVANSTGCSSVYASTMPFTPFLDPWVNSLFQDAQPMAAGIFEGLGSKVLGEVKALRTARAEIADAYDPAVAAATATLGWRDFTEEELALLPTVLTISGDGAAYDIGFGAMSRVLAGGTPIKAIVLDTGSYSNTGGQASTASYTGQDADLARFGKAHGGKRETRKELGLLASFHPGTFVSSVSTALYPHFLATTLQMLNYSEGASVMEVYTPCGTENGVAEDLSNARSRLAVESRLSPLFVHDPRRGETLPERFSLDGNPDPDSLWTTSTLEYLDDAGNLQLMQTPLTPAEFALGEVRFAKQFTRIKDPDAPGTVPIAEYVELDDSERWGKVPFVYATDKWKHLIKVACAEPIVRLVEDRRWYWNTLRFLSGRVEAEVSATHRAELEALRAQYAAAEDAREASLDSIAAAMAELATSSVPRHPGISQSEMSGAQRLSGAAFVTPGGARSAETRGPGAAAAATPVGTAGPAAGTQGSASDKPIWLDPADEHLCNDCGTCYQELPQLFEKATIVVDGAAQVVGRMKTGALDGLELTPDLEKRIRRVKDTCDAEIIT